MRVGEIPQSLSILGLGYVGCVSAACFASRGHRVVGVDVDPTKTRFLREGRAPIVEERIERITAAAVASGLLTATQDAHQAISTTDVTMVCVGTPSRSGGGLSTVFLERVTEGIGRALADMDSWHVVAYRSTMTPGTCQDLLIPTLERLSGKKAGRDFGVCVNPEFLREGTSVRDFFHPPKTVVGATDERTEDQVLDLFADIGGPRFRVGIGIAEMIKYVDNSFHALKVGFGNEIGAICAALGLDSHQVMDVFLADTKLNISGAYLRPGFAFGGSCLPKDVRALTHTARLRDVDVPILSNVLISNETHMRRALDMIIEPGRRRIGILGLAFKSGTDDLRESPMVELAERLIGKGFDVLIYDPRVVTSRLTGANAEYIKDKLPHIGDLLTDDAEAILAHSEVLVAGARDAATIDVLRRATPGTTVVDLVRLPDAPARRSAGDYVGIGW
ncbi:nucleotide sugar dehydrogenase [Tomitella fengzijianii]|uniref:UDP-glucose 6-dehydrogenase n=1 Tax=Tomitella fengzijianii TaxID=2597660 RepID=A0A516X0Q5_9ACTN|nr:nucleotide sugar dehydrogenase [Tomitella fengzijianii]QDQ96669.1 nucleotide sugar dehydrogenase [Tomitella fengzijianii]